MPSLPESNFITELEERYFNKGKEEGIKEGIREGREEELKKGILKIVSKRFNLSTVEKKEIEVRLARIKDIDKLTDLFDIALDVSSVEEFKKLL